MKYPRKYIDKMWTFFEDLCYIKDDVFEEDSYEQKKADEIIEALEELTLYLHREKKV